MPSLLHLRSDKFPEEMPVVIEIPQGSSIKYELDKESGVMMVDRFLQTAMFYPFNYGFVPDTKADDGDAVDVLVISAQPILPGCAIMCRPIAMLEMEDEAGMDEKVLAVPVTKVDRTYGAMKDVADVDDVLREKIHHFFAHYKELEKGKWVKIKNFLDKSAAIAAIKKAS